MTKKDDRQDRPEVPSLPLGRALVVDHDRRDLKDYTEVLRRMGFEVKQFLNYQEASRCLEKEPVDFVFVNQGSSTFEAKGVVERALARNRHTPVVVLAQCLDMECYLEAMQLGAVDYWVKPLAPAEVEHLVTTHWQPHVMQRHHMA